MFATRTPVKDMRVGDKIATKTSNDGRIIKSEPVKEIKPSRSGTRLIVNNDQVWDIAGFFDRA